MGLFYLAPLCSLLALAIALSLIFKIFKYDEGTPQMKEIANAVREGASAYLNRQYRICGFFFLIIFAILLLLSLNGYLVIFVPFAFLTGGLFSGLAGFCGMKIATHSSARTAYACRLSLNAGLNLAFSSGAVMGFIVVGLGLLDVSTWYYTLDWYYTHYPLATHDDKLTAITSTMLCFGMGAGFQALFARVGGGIFTKAADVGADLVGKVEAGIPEDDWRNPAVIADNVGDNVGDVAGMGSDLYQSYADSIVATAALGVAAGLGVNGVVLPMLIAAVGIIASMGGMVFVRTKEDVTQQSLLTALRKGLLGASLLFAVAACFLIHFVLGAQYSGIGWSVMIGLLAGLLIGFSTEFFTSSSYRPTRSIADAALTGPATVIIEGLSKGMLSATFPMIIVSCSIIGSFAVSGGFHNLNLGIYGVAIAAVGMLSTLGFSLATDAYGPVADNAGGIAQMAGMDPKVRERTDALDSLGNTTAAIGKGFAIGSAMFTTLALISAFREKVALAGKEIDLNLMNPIVLVGLFLGAVMPYLFSSLAIKAVGRSAGKIVLEVRKQFKEIKGLMEGKAKPNYAQCVDIVTQASLREMLAPSLIAVIMPIVVGLLLGVNGIGGFLVGAMASGFLLAILMANAGGAWDNAKKYIEEGNHGGKGKDPHKASVVGDTVGDPLKDTSGPSINILIKLMSMVSIVFAVFILQHTLIK